MFNSLARYRDPALTVLVLLDAIYLFMAAPLEQMGMLPRLGDVAVQLAIVAVVFVVCSGSRLAEIIVAFATLSNVSAILLRHVSPSALTVGLDIATRVLFLCTVIFVVGRAVFAPKDVTHHRIQGAIAIYLNIAVLFAFGYRAIDELVPGSFSTGGSSVSELSVGQSVYFSFTTLTTTGYGDILPKHPFARSAANLEGLIGQLFPATLLARIVTLEIETRRSKGDRS